MWHRWATEAFLTRASPGRCDNTPCQPASLPHSCLSPRVHVFPARLVLVQSGRASHGSSRSTDDPSSPPQVAPSPDSDRISDGSPRCARTHDARTLAQGGAPRVCRGGNALGAHRARGHFRGGAACSVDEVIRSLSSATLARLREQHMAELRQEQEEQRKRDQRASAR